jgi:hypothetical protein
MSAWSVLPNARHIDWVIESAKKHPDLWSASVYAEARRLRASYIAARRGAARRAVRKAARPAVWGATYNATNHLTLWATRDSILALIAYDDCDQYLAMTSEELRAWVLLTEHPTAMLLLPMVIVREQIEQLAAA